MRPRWLLALLARGSAAVVVVASAACTTPQYVIQEPAAGATVACNPGPNGVCRVLAKVAWQGVSVNPAPDLSLDDTAVPNALTVPPNASFVSGTLAMAPGAHKIDIAGLLSDGASVRTYTASSAFTVSAPPAPPGPVGSFTLTIAAPTLLVERTRSATVAVSVVRVAPFAGPVTVGVSPAVTPPGMPVGVTAGALTIAAGQSSGMLTLAAAAAAKFGSSALVVRGSGPSGVPPNSASLRVIVGRATGNFAEASPTPYASTLPSNVTSHTSAFRVEISVGAPSLPQPRKAVFFKGAVPVGNEIGFTLGPVSTLGGAGFCDDLAAGAIARGVVLSGALPGFASQNVVTFVDLTGNPNQLLQVSADMQSSAPAPHVFQPRVYFSPDCSVAMLAGVNKPGPLNNVLQVIDLTTGSRLGNEVSFNSASFAAKIKTVGAAQQLEVTVDTGAPTAQTISVNLP